MATTTLYIEIPVEIMYSIDPGQKGRFSGPPEDCWPEYPACVEDKVIDEKQIMSEVRRQIYEDETIDEQLMEIANQNKMDEMEYLADLKYNEMKER